MLFFSVQPTVFTAEAMDPEGPQEARTGLMSVSHPRPDRSSVETLMAQCFIDRAQGFLFMVPADLLIFVARAEALIVSLRSFCVSYSTKLAWAVRPSHTKLEQRAGHAPRIPLVLHVHITSLELSWAWWGSIKNSQFKRNWRMLETWLMEIHSVLVVLISCWFC